MHTVQCACDAVLHRVNTGLISRNPNSISPEVMKRLDCQPARVWISRACQWRGRSGRSFLARSDTGMRMSQLPWPKVCMISWRKLSVARMSPWRACRPAAVQHECRREVRAVEQADRLIQAWQLGRQRQFTATVVAQLASSSAWLSVSSRRTARTGAGLTPELRLVTARQLAVVHTVRGWTRARHRPPVCATRLMQRMGAPAGLLERNHADEPRAQPPAVGGAERCCCASAGLARRVSAPSPVRPAITAYDETAPVQSPATRHARRLACIDAGMPCPGQRALARYRAGQSAIQIASSRRQAALPAFHPRYFAAGSK
jgi:hypothetical protein